MVRGSIRDKEKKYTFFLNHPDRPWGPLSQLSNRYRGSFPRCGRDVKLTIHLYLVPTLRNEWSCAFMPSEGTALYGVPQEMDTEILFPRYATHGDHKIRLELQVNWRLHQTNAQINSPTKIQC